MELVRLRSPEDKLFARAMALYGESFPLHEQREAASQRRALACEDYHFDLIEDEGTFVGLMLYWETESFLYVEHFCTDPALRNGGYGRRALDLLGDKGKTVILEIDPPVDQVSIRRKGFYQRAGFQENPYPHVHPPYRAGNRSHSLVVLSAPDRLSPEAYDGFFTYLKTRVMGV